MDSNKSVYKLLNKLGLQDAEIQEIDRVNVNLKLVIAKDVMRLIQYLESQGLSNTEIREISKGNPWVLTENFQRIRFLEQHYKTIGIQNETYKQLLIKYPIAISLNPINVKTTIEKLTQEGLNIEQIQEQFLNHFDEYFSI